jgi:cytoskeletal protein RodZ
MNQNFETISQKKESQRGNGMSNFLSGVAVLLSSIALLFSGFSAYQVFNLQQTISQTNNATNQTSNPSGRVDTQQPENATIAPSSSPTLITPSASPTPVAPSTPTAAIAPGQYVQKALGTKAEVELLKVKRIKDPEAGTYDVVNVQMRFRRLATEVTGSDYIYVGQTTARNPDTNETYKAVDPTRRSTGGVGFYSLRPQASVDAYIWLRVPESATSLDIFIPETAAFQNVPISN